MEFGKVKSLWRYPIESLIGEGLYALDIDSRRVSGDRAYAVSTVVHLLTTGSLSILHDLLPKSDIDSRRYRPNIVIDSKYPDQDIFAKSIKIGGAILEITHKTKRYRMMTLDQQDLVYRPEILKTVAKNFGQDFGVYARVISTGSVSIGDSVDVIPI